MEEELKCPTCRQFYNQPVLLPCFHAMCMACALGQQQPVTNTADTGTNHETTTYLPPPPSELLMTDMHCQDGNDSDQLSILSEADSGVAVSSASSSSSSTIGANVASRPGSYVQPSVPMGQPPASTTSVSTTGTTVAAVCLACPVASCRKLVYFDEHGAANLPRYRAMQSIVDKFAESSGAGASTACQLCPDPEQQEASVFCQQCQVFYCDRCRDSCHPARGPLAKHSLVTPQQGRQTLRSFHDKIKAESQQGSRCQEHADQAQTYYCNTCRTGACHYCVLADGRHQNHDVHLLAVVCKQQKAELTQSLQQLSEKAKKATELIQRLKSSTDHVQESCAQIEATIHLQCQELIEALKRREEALVEFARRERDLQLRRLRGEVGSCTHHLQHTTSLVQFCIEALKEADPSAFLQIGSMLVNRVSGMDMTWRQEMEVLSHRASPTLELTLDDIGLRRHIDQLTFLEMKAPGAPCIVAEECSAENNSITVAWQASAGSFVEGFVLELDDGTGANGAPGRFREVYCGKETICTVDGLHFNSLYNARVKAFNSSGDGPYSECLGLHTAEVAWFTFDTATYPAETRLSADGLTATTDSYEPRVLLSSVGFSRGTHYWEFAIDRYDGTADPAFGIARRDVSRDLMLGKDELGWSMYIDHQRSWFLHNNVHSNRTEGGIDAGCTVGVLLDLDNHQLSFYVNEEPQGTVAFSNLTAGGVYYPAVSLNRNVQVTLHSALDPPSAPHSTSCPDSGEESDECHQRRNDQAINDSTMTSITCSVAAL